MRHVLSSWRSWLRTGNEIGATSTEYAVLASLIAVVIISAVTLLGQYVRTLFSIPGGL